MSTSDFGRLRGLYRHDENRSTIGMINGWRSLKIVGRARDNGLMRQLQLFTTAQLATMRDRTRSRKYSPQKDEFRREHERHRDWGQCHVA
jgi:hypothetical protein